VQPIQGHPKHAVSVKKQGSSAISTNSNKPTTTTHSGLPMHVVSVGMLLRE